MDWQKIMTEELRVGSKVEFTGIVTDVGEETDLDIGTILTIKSLFGEIHEQHGQTYCFEETGMVLYTEEIKKVIH